ncbi:MAG TPA: metallophosphoesterase [Gammaproteobacteria bacterium]|nr:metallophosphoesterase [Gammaproteobacteria bacterium]
MKISKKLNVLHLSDVHFGIADPHGHQEIVVKAAIRKIHEHLEKNSPPDLLLFTGDLAQRGAAEDFKKADQWLDDLLAHEKLTQCQLFFIPGNHEVARPAGKDMYHRIGLRTCASRGVIEFKNAKKELTNQPFTEFLRWHKSFRSRYQNRVLSDWKEDVLCEFSLINVTINDINILLLGVNSALLSCDDQDEGHLIVLPRILNEHFSGVDADRTLIFVLSHHPFEESGGERWLAGWSSKELQPVMMRSNGPHLFFHGHVHKQQGSTINTMAGQGLTTISGGACYQSDKYPMHFSFYSLDLVNQTIAPCTYKYNTVTGQWGIDSEVGSAPIPVKLPTAFIQENKPEKELQKELSQIKHKIFLTETCLANTRKGIKKLVEYQINEGNRLYCISKIHSVYLTNDNGDCSVTERIALKSLGKSIHVWLTAVYGDDEKGKGSLPAESVESLDLRFDCNDGEDITYIGIEDEPFCKRFAVFFLPEIPENGERFFTRTYHWKGLLQHFVNGKNKVCFDWSYPFGDKTHTTDFKVEFLLPKHMEPEVQMVLGDRTIQPSRKGDFVSLMYSDEAAHLYKNTLKLEIQVGKPKAT